MLQKRLGDVRVDLGTFVLFGTIADREWLIRIRDGRYEPYMISLFESVLHPGLTVLDAGAHIGLYSVLAGTRVGSEGAVISFEPNPVSFRLLHKNIRANGLEDRATCIDAALSESEGTSSLFFSDLDRDMSSLHRTDDHESSIDVRTVALDEFLPEGMAIDVIKIDIEGAEMAALRGMESVLKRNSQVVLFIECFPEGLIRAGSHPEEMLTFLRHKGFSVRVIDERERALRYIEKDHLSRGGFVNLCALRR